MSYAILGEMNWMVEPEAASATEMGKRYVRDEMGVVGAGYNRFVPVIRGN